jgi:hypothetical protein
MSAISLRRTLDINAVTRLVALTPGVTKLLLSEPGCGKTSVLRTVAEYHGDKWRDIKDRYPTDKFQYVYIDAPNTRDGDLFLNYPDKDTKTLEQWVTSLIDFNDPRPKVILVDEALKVLRYNKPLFTRLFLEYCVGNRKLPENSIVLATSNNSGEGLGDSLGAHEADRITVINMAKPSADNWANGWASNNGISSITRACVRMNPRVMASYMDGVTTKDNPYIYHPKTNPTSFVSPRSLALMDVYVRNRAVLGEDVTAAAIEGTTNPAFAQLLSSFIALEKELIDPRKPLTDGENTPLPTNPAALLMLMYNMVDIIETQDEMTNAITYVTRAESRDMQSVFMSMLADNNRTTKLGAMNAKVKDWMVKNHRIAR